MSERPSGGRILWRAAYGAIDDAMRATWDWLVAWVGGLGESIYSRIMGEEVSDG